APAGGPRGPGAPPAAGGPPPSAPLRPPPARPRPPAVRPGLALAGDLQRVSGTAPRPLPAPHTGRPVGQPRRLPADVRPGPGTSFPGRLPPVLPRRLLPRRSRHRLRNAA